MHALEAYSGAEWHGILCELHVHSVQNVKNLYV